MIIEADLHSAELRVCAILANDRPFLDIFAAGGTPHAETACELFNRTIDKKKDEEEYVFTKSFTYKWIYTHPDKPPSNEGGQLRLYTVDLPNDALSQMNAKMNRLHPAVVLWKRGVLGELHATRKITTVFGRYRHFGWALSSWDRKLRTHCENAALNFKVQPVIGDIMNRAFIKADTLFKAEGWPETEGLIIQNHDALIVDCSPEHAYRVKEILKEAIETPVPELDNAVIPCEFKQGATWGDAKPC